MITEKDCKKCHRVLPAAAFPPSKKNRSGLYSYCRQCQRIRSIRYRSTPEQKARESARTLAWSRTPEGKRARKAYELKRKYGITIEHLDATKAKQKNLCAICFELPKTRALAIDHCHKTGKVRGLLCTRCNQTLGAIREDVEILINMTAYIDEHYPGGLKPIGV